MKTSLVLPRSKRTLLFGDVLCLLTILALAVLIRLPGSSRGESFIVELSRNGELLQRWEYSAELPPSVAVWEDKTIEFSSQGVRFSDSACPDRSCVHTGWLSRDGELSVCIPSGLVLTLHCAAQGSTDATAR